MYFQGKSLTVLLWNFLFVLWYKSLVICGNGFENAKLNSADYATEDFHVSLECFGTY